MENMLMSGEPCFTVGNPVYVIARGPNPNWSFSSLTPFPGCCTMILNRGGKAHYDFDGHKEHYIAEKGDVVFVAFDETYHPHSDRDDPWAFTSVQFEIAPDEDTRQRILSLPKILHHQNNPQIPLLFESLRLEWTTRSYGWSMKCRGILYEIMCENLRCGMQDVHVPHAAKLRMLMAAMDDDPAHVFTSDEMSAITGLSPDALRRYFRQLTGTSPVQYLNRLRINRARELLSTTDCNVSEAAWAVGFSDIYYFSRLFKKLDGHNPSYYISLQTL